MKANDRVLATMFSLGVLAARNNDEYLAKFARHVLGAADDAHIATALSCLERYDGGCQAVERLRRYVVLRAADIAPRAAAARARDPVVRSPRRA
jgi:hypothetical protein